MGIEQEPANASASSRNTSQTKMAAARRMGRTMAAHSTPQPAATAAAIQAALASVHVSSSAASVFLAPFLSTEYRHTLHAGVVWRLGLQVVMDSCTLVVMMMMILLVVLTVPTQ
jgi:flagellar biosynthesis protein FlhB